MAGRRGLRWLLLLCVLLGAAAPAGERRRAGCRRRVPEPPARLASARGGRALPGLRGCRAGCGMGCGPRSFRREAARGARVGSLRGRTAPRSRSLAPGWGAGSPERGCGRGSRGVERVREARAGARGALGARAEGVAAGRLDGPAAGLGFQPALGCWGARSGGKGRGGSGHPARRAWPRPRLCSTSSGSRLATCLKAVCKHKKP